MTSNIHESRSRRKLYAEVFTPRVLVKQMLDKLPSSVWYNDQKFLDPACGDGAFLVEVLRYKIKNNQYYDHYPIEALKTIYGVDIIANNVRDARWRLLKIISTYEEITREHIEVVIKNVVYINQKYHPTGSLEYPFSFDNEPKEETVNNWLDNMKNGILSHDGKWIVDEEKFAKYVVKKGQTDMFA